MSEAEPPGAPGSDAPGMGRRFVRGAFYVGGANWITYALNFAIAVLVARILGPEAFGLYAFVVAVNEFVNIVNGLAVAPALVQSREESRDLYDSGYAISFAQGAVGVLVTLALVPFFDERGPEVVWFLLLLSVARFGVLLADVVLARLDRQVRYGVIASIHLATRSVPNFLCLGLAFWGWGAWSLIVRDLTLAFLPLLLAHAWSGWWFHGRVTREAVRTIFAYSGRMFAARILDIVLERSDRLVVGWLMGNRAVGLYHQSRFLGDAGLVATIPVSQVTFNLYARLRDEPERLARAFSLVNFCIVRAFFAFAAVLIVEPEATVRLLLGPEWIDVAPLLRALGVYAGLGPVLRNMQILFYARGDIWDGMRMRLAQLAVLLPGVVLAAWLGSLDGVAWVYLASSLVALAAGWGINRALLRGNGWRIFGVPILALVVTIVAWGGLSGPLAQLPAWALPAMPPLVYSLLLIACEPRRIWQEMGYLRAQFTAGSGSGHSSDEPI